jgi:hypothetical protein
MYSILFVFSAFFIENSNASTESKNLGEFVKESKVCKMGPLDPRRSMEEDTDPSDNQPPADDE